MKILIASRWFKPVMNPRSFRTTELVNELLRKGHNIDLFIPEGSEYSSRDKLKVHTIAIAKHKNANSEIFSSQKVTAKRKFLQLLKDILVYFLGDSPFQIMYAWSLYHKINDSLKTDKYDAIISISYPFYVNVAAACAIKRNQENCGITIADCGDPFFYNPAIKRPIYFKWLEKFTLQKFDFISLPIKEAIPAYKSYNVEEKIRIIPQGFEITDIDEKEYIKNRVPTFCFAGMFYENIRNPQFFLDFLLSLKDDFKFIVYILPNEFSMNLLAKYSLELKEKLEVRTPLERSSLIKEMAKMDFLINFDNSNSSQKPSKLIDYAITKRPIISFNEHTFNKENFIKFFNGDYTNQEKIDVSQYDIKNIARKFEELITEGKR